MSNTVRKNFHLLFSKFRCFPTVKPPSSPPLVSSLQTSDNSSTSDDFFLSSFSSSTSDSDAVPDFTAVFASHRFFFSAPGSSNSIFHSPDPLPGSERAAIVSGVKVQKLSKNPYGDFRESMQEMVESRDELMDMKSEWQYLEQLLLSYLHLNSIETHQFIFSAFSDLVLYLLHTPELDSGRRLRPSFNNASHWFGQSLVVGESWNVSSIYEDKQTVDFDDHKIKA